jgi:Pentapeptide repeats (9 copies)
MDTTLNNSDKKIGDLIILNEGGDGYGPEGAYTRHEWRETCLYQLLKGSNSFKTWQDSWIDAEREHFDKLEFGYQKKYDDGTLDLPILIQSHRCSLDYVCRTLKSYIAYDMIFQIDALFNNIKVEGIFELRGAIFKCKVNFNNAYFNELTSFRNAVFKEEAFFSKTVFTNLIDFSISTFENDIFFNNADFKDDAFFMGAIFENYANFFKAKFSSQCRFDCRPKSQIQKLILERETQFLADVNFKNSEIKNVGHFERVHFKGSIPNFLGVDNAKTLLVFSGDEYFNKDDSTEDAVKRIGQLKRLADEQGQTDQALMFNAFELNAKSKQPNASSLFIVFTWLYKKVSNYGRSFGRPLFTYLGLVAVTYLLVLVHSAIYSPQNCKGELWRVLSDWRNNGSPSCISYELPDDKYKINGYRAAVEYTLYRSAGIFDFSDNGKGTETVANRLFGQPIEPWWMRIWGVFKAIASTALLFLAALGLRNKYRIK